LGKSIQEVATNVLYSKHGFTFVGRDEIDFSNNVNISTYFECNSFDVIVNCAAYTQVDRAEEQQELANQINHLAVGQLADIAQQSNTKLIHISTDYVFDGNATNSYIELDVPNPINAYAKTKLLGEQAVQNAITSKLLHSKYVEILTLLLKSISSLPTNVKPCFEYKTLVATSWIDFPNCPVFPMIKICIGVFYCNLANSCLVIISNKTK
jgi:hypothetical protein